MRSIALAVAFCVRAISLPAQDVFSNSTNTALEKVIRDYPNRFHNIKGELVAQHNKTTQFRSTVQVPGASSCLVTRQSIANSEVYSWTCTAFETGEFNRARNKFKEIFDQIENTIIKIEGEKPFIVSGQYRTPIQERKYTSISFDLLPTSEDLKKLRIDLTIQNVVYGWKICLNVYDSEHRDDESVTSN